MNALEVNKKVKLRLFNNMLNGLFCRDLPRGFKLETGCGEYKED